MSGKGNAALPTRPKRAMSAHSLFVKEFMKKANEAWNDLSDSEKQKYEKRCYKDKGRFDVETFGWNKEEAVKRPASSYALYSKEAWEREEQAVRDRDFDEMTKYASTNWKDMTKSEKDVYFEYCQKHALLRAKYVKKMDKMNGNDEDKGGRSSKKMKRQSLRNDQTDDDSDIDTKGTLIFTSSKYLK